jgi:hypothetical protein
MTSIAPKTTRGAPKTGCPAFFGRGEIFSLFPSTLTDTFGKLHATTHYGFL